MFASADPPPPPQKNKLMNLTKSHEFFGQEKMVFLDGVPPPNSVWTYARMLPSELKLLDFLSYGA